MSEINIASLPVMPSNEFTDNDMFVGINNGKAQLITTPTLSTWIKKISNGEKGEQGVAGADGRDGRDGRDGVSVTHRWNGTTLILTSSSGTSSVDLKGSSGLNGLNGADGKNGWSPILAVVARGEEEVLRVTGWTGGTGSQPQIGQYISATGFVNDINQAINIRGSQGIQGVAGADGAKGEDGEKGADGTGITAVEYLEDGSLKITKTDNEYLQTSTPPKQNGWQKYKDTQYNQTTPFLVTAQQEVVIPNNSGEVAGSLPSTIEQLYTSSNQKMNLKESSGLYSVRVRFKITPTTDVVDLKLSFSKDTTEIPFVHEVSLPQKTLPQHMDVSTFIHGDSTLASNGLSVRLFVDKNISIYDVEFLVSKLI